MGLDIWGWMEIKNGDEWKGVADLSKEIERNYPSFAVLFGVSKLNIIPLGHSGKPSGMSNEMCETAKGYADKYLCWCSWSEIKKLDFINNVASYTIYTTELYLKTNQGEIYKGSTEVPSLIRGEEYQTLLEQGVFETHRYIYRTKPKIEEFYFDDGWFKLFEVARQEEQNVGEK